MITLVAILTCRHGSDGAGIEPGPARRVVREGQPAHEKLVGRLFVQRQGKDCNTPLCSRTSTHGSFLQKTRHTRPDCPQQGLDSETIVIDGLAPSLPVPPPPLLPHRRILPR